MSIGWGLKRGDSDSGLGLTSKVKRGSRSRGIAPGHIIEYGTWRGLGCIIIGAYLGSPGTVGDGGLGHSGEQQNGRLLVARGEACLSFRFTATVAPKDLLYTHYDVQRASLQDTAPFHSRESLALEPESENFGCEILLAPCD